MAVRTFRMVNAAHASGYQDSAESDQTAANATVGWTPGKTATANYSQMAANTKRASGTFATTPTYPDSLTAPDSTLKDCMICYESGGGAFSGTFDNSNWVFTYVVRETTSNAGVWRMRMQLFAATNTAGTTGVRELTGAAIVGTNVNPTTAADATGTCTFTPGGTVTLTSEYLFVQVACEVVTAAGATGADVVFRVGDGSTTGTKLVTPNYTASGGSTEDPFTYVGGGYYPTQG